MIKRNSTDGPEVLLVKLVCVWHGFHSIRFSKYPCQHPFNGVHLKHKKYFYHSMLSCTSSENSWIAWETARKINEISHHHNTSHII
jgi:hypothetical protein